MSAITGLSYAQIASFRHEVDWQSGSGQPVTGFIVPIACLMLCIGIAYVAFTQISYNLAAPVELIYNLAISLVLLGCLSYVSTCFPEYTRLPGGLHLRLSQLGLCAVALGLIGLLLISVFATSDNEQFMLHLAHSRLFTLYGLVLLSLVYLPTLHIRMGLNANRAYWRNAQSVQTSFDYSQVLITGLVLVVYIGFDSNWLTDEIFALCMGCLSLINGRELTQYKSSYFASLSDKDKSMFRFYVRARINEDSRSPLARPMGVISILIGLALLGLSFFRLTELIQL